MAKFGVNMDAQIGILNGRPKQLMQASPEFDSPKCA